MPLKLTAPIYKTFRLEETDKKYGDDGDPTTIMVRQATQREHEERMQLFSILKREYEEGKPETMTLVQVLSLEELKRLEVRLTLVACNVLDESGGALFKFRSGDNPRLDMTPTQFNNAWGLLPPDVANEIHAKVLEVNAMWTGLGEAQ
jgi:hypothetical protein